MAVAFDNLDFLEKQLDFTKLLPDGFEPKKRLEALQLETDNEDEETEEKTLLPAIVKSHNKIAIRGKGGELVSKSAVSNYLAERTWRGMEIGEKTAPAKLQQGLDGYAAGYKNYDSGLK